MLTAVEGIYKNGEIQLLETPEGIHDSMRVVVTFLPAKSKENPIDLRKRNIDAAQAADLRFRMKTMEDDWNRPEMDAYDEL